MAADNMIDPSVPPTGTGCVECLAAQGWWFHLRRCAACGHIGCCDSSPSRHARQHAADTGHRIMCSFEPGEAWFWDFAAEQAVSRPRLAPPRHRPVGQPAPGPAARVPKDWRRRLH
jgi:hypothetical protein